MYLFISFKLSIKLMHDTNKSLCLFLYLEIFLFDPNRFKLTRYKLWKKEGNLNEKND